ncbi:MAG: threonine synthase [Vicinamibacterales bacterium]
MAGRFVSTRGAAPPVPLAEALAAGLAPDGGLYVPEALTPLPAGALEALRGASFADVSSALARHLLAGALDPGTVDALVRDALDFDVPLVEVDEGTWALETFHGPTFAFKDVGARVMARLVAATRGDGDPLTVLVATSGDTGSAVAQAFFGVPGTRVVVLYPDGQVTPVQEAQFATLGGNVTAVAVAGTFDDCQRLAKAAFADPALRARVRLTSANSISIGRLLPQAFYYAHGLLQLPPGARPVISVPSGNFGNLTAGLLAERLGVPVSRWVAATTINDTVPRYLASGRVEPRPSVTTLANAMDVGDPSNLERLRWMFGDDVAALRGRVKGSVHTDAEVREAIADLWRRRRYLADPHSAIAWLGLSAAGRRPGEPGLFVATAHPAKFREAVEPAIGETVPLPPALAAALARPRIVTRIAPELEALRAML